MDKSGRRFLEAFPAEAIVKKNNIEMMLEFSNGSIFQLGGSNDYDSHRGVGAKLVVFSEYADSNPAAWEAIFPMLDETGGAAIFVYTVKGMNHGYTLYNTNKDNPNWYIQNLTVDDTRDNEGNRIITEEMIVNAKNSGIRQDVIDREYYNDFFAAIPGSVYGDLLDLAREERRITNIAIDPSVVVYTAWDLGYRDSTAIWFVQSVGKEIRFVHYYQNRGHAMTHYMDYVNAYGFKNNIRYGGHFAPHDSKKHELQLGKTMIEFAAEQGFMFNLGFPNNRIPDVSIDSGINATREFFNRFWFDENECAMGLSALRSYHRKYDAKLDIYSEKPEHDWASDGADALRYFSVAWQDRFGTPRNGFQRVSKPINPYAYTSG
jgi:hypothetical protein